MTRTRSKVPSPITGWLAVTTAALVLSGCAVSDTAAEQRIDRERTQAAEAARQSEQIKALEKQLEAKNNPPAAPPAQAPQPAGGQAQAPSNSPAGRVPTSGTYAGTGHQRGLAGTAADKSYGIEMVFSSGGSTIRYPDLGCSGRLQPAGFDQGRRVYREQMNAGRCDNGGTWLVSVDSDARISGTYRPPSGRYVVSAELTR